MLRRTPRIRIRIRPFVPGDEAVVDTVFAGLSAASRRRRYLAPVERLSPSVLAALRAVDGERHAAVVAEAGRGRTRQPVGIARYVVDGPGRAEIAYEVVDAWQGRGVGTRLVGALIDLAVQRGIGELHATVLPDNAASLAVLGRHLPSLRIDRGPDGLEVSASLTASLTSIDVLGDLQVA